ncbi:YcaO-like family protein [Streptomyces sp. MMBL 11-3]|uniref:YcaO-like family protein n=1 Tax=Streptomyces sp. MMBL 11-3 TaxID=3382639 RepID=UPI0039B67DB1
MGTPACGPRKGEQRERRDTVIAAKLCLPGTHRDVDPETTWARVSPLLADYGITRVADVTGLDNIGIPVMLAVRPYSEVMAVSQGKGATPLLAKLSAVMESIELWHAERLPVPAFRATAAELNLGYDLVADVNGLLDVSVLNQLRMSWVYATPIGAPADAQPDIPVPVEIVRLAGTPADSWRPRIFSRVSNGLASGNTLAEASLHALYEVIERDVTSTLTRGGMDDRVHIDLDSVTDPHLAGLLERLRAAEVSVEVAHIPNRYTLPTFVAYIWSPLFPGIFAGSGTHSDAAVAMSRALTEAVQSRLTRLTGTRDSIDSDWRPSAWVDPGLGKKRGRFMTYDHAVADHHHRFGDSETELRAAAMAVEDQTGHRPLFVDLSRRPDLFRVVRVVCPGLLFTQAQHGSPVLVR